MFNHRTVRPRLVRVLHRALESPNTSAEDKARIETVLENQDMMAALTEKVTAFSKENGAPDPGPTPTPTPTHPFLDWLVTHLPQILAFIMQIISMFGG